MGRWAPCLKHRVLHPRRRWELLDFLVCFSAHCTLWDILRPIFCRRTFFSCKVKIKSLPCHGCRPTSPTIWWAEGSRPHFYQCLLPPSSWYTVSRVLWSVAVSFIDGTWGFQFEFFIVSRWLASHKRYYTQGRLLDYSNYQRLGSSWTWWCRFPEWFKMEFCECS